MNINALLFDLNGVVYIDDTAIPGAAETIAYIEKKGIPHAFVTNNTRNSIASLEKKLSELGLPIDPDKIISPAKIAIDLLKSRNAKCFPVINDNILPDFKEFICYNTDAEYILIGDYGDNWDYKLYNTIFNMAMNGAKVIALHKGRFWQAKEGLRIDIGAYITGLEYAAGIEAEAVGKPEKAFFDAAVKGFYVDKSQIAMIGDDVISDIGGAQNCGLKGILVKTGKYRKEHVEKSGIKPDLTIDAVNNIIDALEL